MQRNAYPFFGTIVHEGDTDGFQVSYRFHITDPVRFEKSLRVTIEHGHANHLSDDWSSTAYWYQTCLLYTSSCYITGFDEQKTVERQYEFHKKLVEACKTRDADIICEELRNHYMNSVRYFMEAEGLPEDSFNAVSYTHLC